MKKTSVILFFFALYLTSVLGQENLNTTRAGVWPYGPGDIIANYEDHIFLSYGRTVRIYETTNPEQPQLLGEVFTDDMIRGFAFENNTAFAAGYTRFFILDITDFAQPEIISSLDIEVHANAICLSNGYVYLALQSAGILIIDINDLHNPEVVGFHQNGLVNYDLSIDNDVAWVASGFSGLTAYDISNPLSPDSLLTYNESGSMRSVDVVGNLLYTTNSSSGIMVFDISNMPQLQLLSSTSTFSSPRELYIHNDLLAVSMFHQGFCLYDISDPLAPDSLSWFYDEWPNRNTILKDDLAFHCSADHFSIINISNPYELTTDSQIELSGVAQYAYYWENHVFIDSYDGPIMTIDVADPQQPVKLAAIQL